MAYQVLARKWRPSSFDEVVGQEPIVTALRNALKDGKIAQAYLFSGIRGVGKTSVARILAKALNCEKGLENAPCNECETCRSILNESNLDILEIDAATYSKVEQVRELTENLRYKPVKGKYKVVVLDEVHRLSRQAFDALLKIIEEPPPHLVFIFATTELESVPATILSRCQEFNFRRVPRLALVAHLRKLAEAEEITVGDKALRLIARAGEGSVRDAVALLDQLATYGSGTIGDDEAGRILGGVDVALHHRLLSAIVGGDRSQVVTVVAEVEDQGWDPRHVFGEFLSYCRDVLHLSLGGSLDQVELPQEEAEAANQLGADAGYENLLRLLHQLLASEEAVRRSEAGLLAVEIAWLRGAELPRLTRIEDLLSGATPTPEASTPASKPPPVQPPPAQAPPEQAPPESGSARQAAEQVETVEPSPPPEEAAPPIEDVPVENEPPLPRADSDDSAPSEGDGLQGVEGFLELVRRRRQVMAAHLADVQSISFADNRLTIVCAPGDPWLEVALRRDGNKEAFEACLASAFGPQADWRILANSTEAPAAQPPETEENGHPESPPTPEPEADDLLEHPTVQAALDVFGGTAEAIDEATPEA